MAKTKSNNSRSSRFNSAEPKRKKDSGLDKIIPADVKPPSAPEIEAAVLGAMMIEREAVPKAIELLTTTAFYLKAHQLIFDAMVSLFESGEPIDTVTLYEELKKREQLEETGGAVYLSKLSQNISSAANIEYHAKIILEKEILRGLISSSHEIAQAAYQGTEDAFELLDRAERRIFEITESHLKKSFLGMDRAVRDALEYIEAIHSKSNIKFSVPTGFYELDEMLGGFQKSDLVIIAARPSMGKTAFALTLARNAAVEHKIPVGIFSLEMSTMQLIIRMLCAEGRLNAHLVRTGKLPSEEGVKLSKNAHRLIESPIYVDDTPAQTVLEIRAKARRLKVEKNIGMIIIDYLQLMQGPASAESREREISHISRSLKSLAKELNIPVIALAQMNRAVEVRSDKRPQLSDLRESGCLSGDTLVLNAKTGERLTIKELAEKRKQSVMNVLALDDDLKISRHKMVKAFYSGKKMVYELKTKTGRSLKASANHPFFKLQGWTRLDELNIGDKIAVARNLPLSIPDTKSSMQEDEIILLAHLLGDGCILERQPYHYTSADSENIQTVKEISKRLFNIEAKLVKQKNWFHLYLTSPYKLTHNKKHPITLWLEKLGLKRVRSYEKIIPDSLFQLGSDKISLFLKHIWATDGNISWIKPKRNRKASSAIYYSTSSRRLSEQIQHLLLRLEIQSKVRAVKSKKGYRTMYHVIISGKNNQMRFLETIGCAGKRGKEIPEMIKALNEISANPNNDIIPVEAWENVIRIYKTKLALSWREFAQKLNMSYCGSSLFKNGISRIRMNNIYQVLPFKIIKDLAESDIYWDEIVSIEKMGVQDVYDATIDSVHNFLANDFVVHNSIEQDADVVMFLNRPEYYGMKTDTDGNSLEGVAELTIGKQRNGPTGEIKLAFIKEYARFENLAHARQIEEYSIVPSDEDII